MLTFYRPGGGWLHRMPAGCKALLLMAMMLGVLLLPPRWWTVAVVAAVSVGAYLVAGLRDGAGGMRELIGQLSALRWILLVTLVCQLIFLGAEAAATNTARIAGSLALAGLLVLTTRVTDLLDACERGLGPLQRLGVDVGRVSLLLAITVGTVPVLARLAEEVRDAQRARGSRPSLRAFVVPFLVVSLKYADQLGEALAARGVR
ncbi:energy-coupling factor transporter transmembrane protein EcfT [Streptomyces sp. AC495_CC817]|uniref:energy-coupling factor transporter transmembrane component T family protein n=1 Tax=Streptomyces sp. AC495_CC817 TaxID=2823900 RepID=UPI001C274301|nr:energy-coupling factor transporter transmembrane protein EcfT [Streptomyces sp. AC495_CC817]